MGTATARPGTAERNTRRVHSVRAWDDTWAAMGRAAEAGRSDVNTYLNQAAEAALGYVRCRRGSCPEKTPPIPVGFGDLSGKPLGEWIALAVAQAEDQHPRHGPVRVGAGRLAPAAASRAVPFREPAS